MIKIVVACGNGMGSSALIKNNVARVLQKNNVEAQIDHTSIGDAVSIARNYDVVICPISFLDSFNKLDGTKIIGIKNLLDMKEIEKALADAKVIFC